MHAMLEGYFYAHRLKSFWEFNFSSIVWNKFLNLKRWRHLSLPLGLDLRFRQKVKYQNFNIIQVHAFLNKGLAPSVQGIDSSS